MKEILHIITYSILFFYPTMFGINELISKKEIDIKLSYSIEKVKNTCQSSEISRNDKSIVSTNEIKKVERSYEFDSVYSITPGTIIARLKTLYIFDSDYILQEYEIVYLGRIGKNVIKIRYIRKAEASGYTISNQDDVLELYVENPDSSSVIHIGGSVEKPTITLVASLKESNMSYKIIGDFICPSK